MIRTEMARTVSVLDSSYTIKTTELKGERATVVVRHRSSRILIDSAGEPHKWDASVVHREVWTKYADGWKINRLEEIRQEYLRRDGKSSS